MKAIKLVVVVILVLLLLVVGAIIAITTLIDPNDYKEEIRTAALDKAGIELQMEGSLSWSFYPWLALELNKVGVGYPQKPALGQLQRAEISVSIPALIGGELQMNRVLIDGLKLELVQTADGNNWTGNDTRTDAPVESGTTDKASASTGPGLAVDIEAIELLDAAVSFTDQASNTRIELSDLNLTSGQVSTGSSFPVSLSFTLKQYVADQLQLSSQLELETHASIDPAKALYRLAGLDALLSLDASETLPSMKLQLAADLSADLSQQQVKVENLSLNTDPLSLTGEINLNNFAEPTLSGNLKSNTFSVKQLLQALGQTAPATTDPDALSKVGFSTTLGGPAGTLQLKPLTLTLDDTTLSGEASLALSTQAIALKLKGGTLDADRYLPPAPENQNTVSGNKTRPAGSTGGWPKDELIPMEPLRALNLNAEVDLESLTINGIQLGNPGLSISAANGLIKLNRLTTRAFEGQINATAQMDARKSPLRITLAPRVTGLQLGAALQTLADTDVMAGKIDTRADLSMSGQSIYAWINSLNGTARIGMAEGLIKGIDAAQSLCQGVNNLSALWINAEQVDKTTPFADLSANFNMRNGVVSNNDLGAKLDAMRVAGRGSINLPQQTMDYRIGLTVEDNLFNQSCSVNDRLEGVEIPVNCKGGFQDEPAKLCRLDTSFIGDLLKAEAKRKVEEKVGGQLEEKLKEKLGDEGAGQVLKGLFGR